MMKITFNPFYADWLMCYMDTLSTFLWANQGYNSVGVILCQGKCLKSKSGHYTAFEGIGYKVSCNGTTGIFTFFARHFIVLKRVAVLLAEGN